MTLKEWAMSNDQSILDAWDYELNKGIDPEQINIYDKNKYWWKCSDEKHSYCVSVSYRISNEKCVYCSNRKVLAGFNDVKTRRENVIDEWDYEKNPISPDELLFSDVKHKVYWKCRFCGDEIFSAPAYHSTPGCRKCRTIQRHDRERLAKIQQGQSLQKEQYDDLKKDWDFKSNAVDNVYWEEITPTYTKPVHWKCHICGYLWKTSVYRRSVEGTGCPSCKHLVVNSGYNDLATEAPELVEEWSPKNLLKPSEVVAGGLKKYLWVCRFCGNEWSASIHNRRVEGSNCSKCRGSNTSFAEQAVYYYLKMFFETAINRYIDPVNKKELDIFIPELNVGIEYDGYIFHKDKQVLDDKKTRDYMDKGIKLIRIRETDAKGNRLPCLYIQPYMCLDYERSTKFSGLDKIIKEIFESFGVCEIDVDSYRDRFFILHAMNQGIREKSFEASGSEHIKYWDYDANNPLLPKEISKGSKIAVNWKCPDCNHKWVRSLSAELKSKGCPVCAKSILSKDYNLVTESPEIIGEWNSELNHGIRPESIMPNTHKKYWWTCPICGKPFQAAPPVWKKVRRCNACGVEQGIEKRCKRVVQYTMDGEMVKAYASAREASKETGIGYKNISQVCRKVRKQTGGFIWKFEE